MNTLARLDRLDEPDIPGVVVCQHIRCDEDGICRACGADLRTAVAGFVQSVLIPPDAPPVPPVPPDVIISPVSEPPAPQIQTGEETEEMRSNVRERLQRKMSTPQARAQYRPPDPPPPPSPPVRQPAAARKAPAKFRTASDGRIYKEENLPCPVAGCGRTFRARPGLISHMRVHEGAELSASVSAYSHGIDPPLQPDFGKLDFTIDGPLPTSMSIDVAVAPATPAYLAPLTLVNNAIDELQRDLIKTRAEIERLTGLQALEKTLTVQVEALLQARQVFNMDPVTENIEPDSIRANQTAGLNRVSLQPPLRGHTR